jgi:hypothetical protein
MNVTLEGSRTFSPLNLSIPRSKGIVIAFWIVTALFCLQIGFTAYAQLRLPQVAEAFTNLGFPDYFRVELAWAKLPRCGAAVCASVGATQGVGLRRLRVHPRLGPHRSPRSGRWPGGVGFRGGHRRALGTLIFSLAPPGGQVGKRLTIENRTNHGDQARIVSDNHVDGDQSNELQGCANFV